MIVLIQGSERQRHAELVDQMHQLRAKVFGGRLGWAVNVENQRERDKFDDLDPLYVLSVDEVGRVVGSLRALQTTGPNMLADVFTELLPIGESVRTPLIWESTRFCVDTSVAERGAHSNLSKVTGELLCGLFEVALNAGLTHVVSVFDVRMERVLTRAGCPSERLGAPVRYGGVLTVAGLFEVSQAMVDRLHTVNAIAWPSVPQDRLSALGIAA